MSHKGELQSAMLVISPQVDEVHTIQARKKFYNTTLHELPSTATDEFCLRACSRCQRKLDQTLAKKKQLTL